MNTIEMKHPNALYTFFFSELWERYGFYVVQSLLALYLAFHFRWKDEAVYALTGSFTALTYLTPFIGGYIADHWIGQKRCILSGSLVLSLSYCMLLFTENHTLLYMALAGVSTGTGLFKSNVSSLLGNQYPRTSALREAGFTIFYMGITIGIILGTTLPHLLQTHYGWHATFLSASFGMLIAFSVFLYGVRRLPIEDYQQHAHSISDYLKTFFTVLIAGSACFFTLKHAGVADFIFILIALGASAWLMRVAYYEPDIQRQQTLIIGLLCLISILFWAFYFQMFLSLTLFLVRAASPTLLGITFPPPYYVAVESIGMLFFGYFLIRKKVTTPATPHMMAIRSGYKFLYAMGLIALAYALITIIATLSNNNHLITPWIILPAYILIAMAELLLSPVGIAATTLLACPKKVSTMTGIYMVSLGLGAYLSGKLSLVTALNPENLSVMHIKAHYSHVFLILLGILLLCVLMSYFIARHIKKSACSVVESQHIADR